MHEKAAHKEYLSIMVSCMSTIVTKQETQNTAFSQDILFTSQRSVIFNSVQSCLFFLFFYTKKMKTSQENRTSTNQDLLHLCSLLFHCHVAGTLSNQQTNKSFFIVTAKCFLRGTHSDKEENERQKQTPPPPPPPLQKKKSCYQTVCFLIA